MDGLIERLRERVRTLKFGDHTYSLTVAANDPMRLEAAAEIERLKVALDDHYDSAWDKIALLTKSLGEMTKERDELRGQVEALREWLDGNTTFYDVDHAELSGDDMNVPVLAAVSRRIWYHATDDQASYPFSAVIDAVMKG